MSQNDNTAQARLKRDWRRVGLKVLPRFLAVAFVIAIGALMSPYFLTVSNLKNVLITCSVVSVIAVGQFLVIVTSGIDLSVGAVASFATVVAALLLNQQLSIPAAIFLALLCSSVFGLFTGLVVVFGKITPFIATLGMLGVAQGFAYLVQNGTYIRIENDAFISLFAGTFYGIPAEVIIFVMVMLVAGWMMRYTTFGRQLYAIGGNHEASRLSGLPVKRNVVLVYVASASLAALGGLMLAAQLSEGSSQVGSGLELDTIAAVVVGGASLFGGLGSPAAAVLGGILIGVISNIMNLKGIPAEPQLIIKGLLILVAVFFTSGKGIDVRAEMQRKFSTDKLLNQNRNP
jgi:ribose transport system permease protein